jgi:hypothetical protein
MARYPGASQGKGRNRTRNRILVISALLVVAVVIAIVYGPGPFGKNEEEILGTPTDANSNMPEGNATVPSEPTQAEVIPAPMESMVIEPNLAKPMPRATVEPNPEAAKMISAAMSLLAEKPSRIIEARDKLNATLLLPMGVQQRTFVKDQLSKLSDEWLFSRKIFPEDSLCGTYRVESGDNLTEIGRQFRTPYELIMKINKIARPELLQLGDTIKVVNGPFHAKVYLSTFTLDIYLQDTFVRSFRVGIGKEGMETPTGLWSVKSDGKLIEPPWPDPVSKKILHAGDPGYALGSRWIGLKGLEGQAKDRSGFGIHGTKDPQSIGTKCSRGCIRLHNGDAKFVYDLLVPADSLVRIED